MVNVRVGTSNYVCVSYLVSATACAAGASSYGIYRWWCAPNVMPPALKTAIPMTIPSRICVFADSRELLRLTVSHIARGKQHLTGTTTVCFSIFIYSPAQRQYFSPANSQRRAQRQRCHVMSVFTGTLGFTPLGCPPPGRCGG